MHFSQLQTIDQKLNKGTMISSQDVDVFEITSYRFSNMKRFRINFISKHVTVNAMKLLITQLQLLITKTITQMRFILYVQYGFRFIYLVTLS